MQLVTDEPKHTEENSGISKSNPDPRWMSARALQQQITEVRDVKRKKILGTDTDDLRRIFLKERPIS